MTIAQFSDLLQMYALMEQGKCIGWFMFGWMMICNLITLWLTDQDWPILSYNGIQYYGALEINNNLRGQNTEHIYFLPLEGSAWQKWISLTRIVVATYDEQVTRLSWILMLLKRRVFILRGTAKNLQNKDNKTTRI